MYKLKLKEANGREAVIYFTTAISLSSANSHTYVRDEMGTTWQTEESVESIEARIDALIAADKR
jgi:hypothetical protein